MSEELSVETTGETVGEAKWAALRELERLSPGLDKGAVRFQVVSEGERGLLGVGYSPARVVATVESDGVVVQEPTGTNESDVATLVRELVTRITFGMGISCRVDVHELDDAVVATCRSSSSSTGRSSTSAPAGARPEFHLQPRCRTVASRCSRRSGGRRTSSAPGPASCPTCG